MTYHLKIQDNQTIEETGHFFQAAPFTITTDTTTLNITFEKNNAHKVVFKIKEGNNVLAELTHPEYVPESTPDTLSQPLKLAIAALLKTGVSKQKDYNDYFDTQTFSYSVNQPQFLPKP